MADGKINRPYGGVLLLGIFLTPLLSLGHDYADGIITAKYFRFAEVVGIGLLLTWMVHGNGIFNSVSDGWMSVWCCSLCMGWEVFC